MGTLIYDSKYTQPQSKKAKKEFLEGFNSQI